MKEVKVHFELVQDEDGYPPASVESVWVRPTPNVGEYVLDSIPFFIQEATIGDVVLVREQDGHLQFARIVRRSHNSLVRVVFFEPTYVERVNEQLVTLGCLTEYIEAHKLLAVSVPDT